MKKQIIFILTVVNVLLGIHLGKAQQLGSLDILTDPIAWANGKSNLAGQVFLDRNFAIYGNWSANDNTLSIAGWDGIHRQKTWATEIQFYPFNGTQKISLFQPKFGRKSRYMRRKSRHASPCDYKVGNFGCYNPYPILQGLFVGVGYQGITDKYTLSNNEFSSVDAQWIKTHELTGRLGYHVQIENISIQLSGQLRYGRATSRPVAFIEDLEPEELLGEAYVDQSYNSIRGGLQLQVGINF